MKKIVSSSLAAVALLLATLAPAEAQRPVELPGRVLWIAGQKLMLLVDGGTSVPVDLRNVPLDQYRGLSQMTGVTVRGTVSPDNTKSDATSIRVDDRWMYQQSP